METFGIYGPGLAAGQGLLRRGRRCALPLASRLGIRQRRRLFSQLEKRSAIMSVYPGESCGVRSVVALLIVAGSAHGGDLQLVEQKFFGGTGNEGGTGIAVVNIGAGFDLYTSGFSEALDGEGLLVRYVRAAGSTNSTASWNTS